MHKTSSEALSYIRDFRKLIMQFHDVEIVIAPPFTAVGVVAEAIKGTALGVAGQDLHWEKQGALTTARKRHEDKQRGQNEYTQIGEAYAAAGKALRDEKNRLLREAGFSARNPFSKRDATQHKNFQKTLGYHSTADWNHRTREEVSGTVPPKMKNWLLRVRGF